MHTYDKKHEHRTKYWQAVEMVHQHKGPSI